MLSAQLRQAIEGSGLSLREIGRKARISPSQLSLFMKGKRSLRLDTADRLAQLLGAPRPDFPAYVLVEISDRRSRIAKWTSPIEDAPSAEYQCVSRPLGYAQAREKLLICYGL
jgi:transcriptional regulator with XRE-family HTH domain